MMTSIRVHATWDPEASVWVAESDDVSGLVTEASSVEALTDKLRGLIPELLEANGVAWPADDEIPFDVVAERRDRVRMAS